MGNTTFAEIARLRRSVRKFEDRPVTDEELAAIIEAARLAPSSNNTQPWRFVAIRDSEKIEAVARAGAALLPINKGWLSKAPCIIICCAEPSKVFHGIVNPMLSIDLATIDVAIAVEHIVLAAAEIGLGTCWIGWFDEKKIRKVVDLPAKWKVIALLAVGWPERPLEERVPNRKLLSEIAFDGGHDRPLGQSKNRE